MNNTARIQASFSLPEVLLEDKIERMGKNQTKMIIPKKRRAVKSSIPRVYAVQVLYMIRDKLCGFGLAFLKVTKSATRPIMNHIRCSAQLPCFGNI